MSEPTETLQQEINALIAELGEAPNIARPAAERAVIEKIRQILDATREERLSSARGIWEAYLPYAANHCLRLSRLEEGWEEALDYFASENSQFWLDSAGALLERGDLEGVKKALGAILTAAPLMKQDKIARVDVLLQALDIAVETSDKKQSIRLYEEAEKVYRKHLAGGTEYTGSAWLGKIKKMGRRLAHFQEKLQRYYQYAESVTFSIEADQEGDLERVIDYLQQNLVGKVKVTRRVKDEGEQAGPGAGRFRARIKITLEE